MITSIVYLVFAFKEMTFKFYWVYYTVGVLIEFIIYFILMNKDYKKHIERPTTLHNAH